MTTSPQTMTSKTVTLPGAIDHVVVADELVDADLMRHGLPNKVPPPQPNKHT